MAESIEQKQHLNAKGIWVECNAIQRACRYAKPEEHRIIEIQQDVSPEQIAPVQELEEEQGESHSRVWYITPYALPVLQKKIDQINNRLKKATNGESELFDFTVETETRKTEPLGMDYEVLKITMNTPRIQQNGYEFVARVDELTNSETGDTDFIVASRNDDNVSEKIELKKGYCEHCGQIRKRNATYVIKDKDGVYHQIGSTCMKAFLGESPQFWALDPDYIKTQAEDLEGYGFGFTRTSPVRTKSLLSLALGLTNGGEYYAGTNANEPTKYLVTDWLYDDKKRKEMQEKGRYFGQPEKWDEKAEEILDNLKFNGASDYERNMSKLLTQPFTDPKFIGYVVSALPAYAKQQGHKKVEKAERVKAVGYIGNVGDKLEKQEALITSIKKTVVAGYSYYSPDQVMLILTLKTPEGKQIKWFSTSSKLEEIEEGQKVSIDRATIKGHQVNDYSGDEETIITRAKLTQI